MKDLLGLAVLFWPLTLLVFIGLAFVVVVAIAVSHAARTGRSKLRWSLIGFFVVFLPIFWDWIPTVVAHKYYCAKEAGFWVYKTLDQWKMENPGVADRLVANDPSIPIPNGYKLNQRFNWIVYGSRFFPINYMIKREEQVVDSNTGEVIARYVDFSTTQVPREAGWSGWKFWLDSRHCLGGDINGGKLTLFHDDAKHIAEGGRK